MSQHLTDAQDAAQLRHACMELEKQIPPEGAMVLLLTDETRTKLRHEAERRLMRPEKLAALILTMIANDDLFAAVLDP